jgi:hypothetical protein
MQYLAYADGRLAVRSAHCMLLGSSISFLNGQFTVSWELLEGCRTTLEGTGKYTSGSVLTPDDAGWKAQVEVERRLASGRKVGRRIRRKTELRRMW